MNEITKFCEKEFFALNAIMDYMNITEPVQVKPETLTKFIEKCHQHQISAQYKLNCMLCFPNTNILSGHWYITYKLTVAIRQFILSRKEKLFPSAEKEISKRQVTNASKARIRYVGGYCIHKIKEEQVSIVKTHMYSKSVEAQEKYEKASNVLTIVQGMREKEEHLKKKNTSDPDSLMDTIRKQCTNKGLTHISDELYQFFVKLCEICLTLLIDKNLNEKGELLFDHCFTEIKRSTELTDLFTHACSVSNAMESTGQSLILPSENSHQIEAVMNGILKKVSIMEYLFTLVIKKFLFIMLVQFRADLIQAFEVAKTMSHRQQIQLRKKKEESLKSITFKTITDDNTDRKHMSHSLLQGMLLRKTAILEPMTKPQLLVLCKAYNLPAKTQSKKAESVKVLTEGILNSQCMSKTEVFVPHASTSAQEPVPSTSTMSSCSTHDSGEPTTHTSRGNVSEAIPITSVLELPILDMETVESDEELCKVCHTKGKSNVEWIQCNSCNQWLHRNCAGLRSKAKWNKFQDEGIPFMCTECI
ncbi:hypothetical protein DPMN_072109 [Dreissena polymorpha]|uniref:PHD-type domain-containing protein n=1 Tax=Dreissena polymorpha TaxID=45954 RepID=A0A9D3Z902_DREPO|nr:hypothetical protein DPMN_072109 [Dreissena polymorpha]